MAMRHVKDVGHMLKMFLSKPKIGHNKVITAPANRNKIAKLCELLPTPQVAACSSLHHSYTTVIISSARCCNCLAARL